MTERLLTVAQAARFYDGFGKKLDSQSFYEAPPLDALAARLDLERCRAVAEFGCGTGRFARQLLDTRLPQKATYAGWDVSGVMVRLASQRLSPYAARATVRQTDGGARLDCPDAAFDRFLCTYVLDILPVAMAKAVLAEARRLLKPDGLVGLACLTYGTAPLPWLVSRVWNALRTVSPMLVGGCRPIELLDLLPPSEWKTEYREVVTPFGIPCEIVVAKPLPTP
jgi:ubiquinone/menaquinone biosynthesis C-methylase UbiE